MKTHLKNLICILLVLINQIAFSQIPKATSVIKPNGNVATVPIVISLFNEIISTLKTAPVNGQTNAYAANYLQNGMQKGKGSLYGCPYTSDSLSVLIIGNSNSTMLLRFTLVILAQNNKLMTNKGKPVTLRKQGSEYVFNWAETATANYELRLSPTKATCPPKEAAYLTVNGRSLIDVCGNAFVLRGVNIGVHNWGYGPLTTNADILEIKKTGANTVRIPWYIQPPDPNQMLYTLPNLEAIINLCVQNGLLPIVEVHDLTTQDFTPAFETTVLNWWTSASVLNLIKTHEKHLIINIANEYGKCLWVGDTQASKDQFENTYKAAIVQLRNAGIRVPLMIDAPDGGNFHEVILQKGQSILNSDPLRNVVFSVHTYWARFKFTFDNNGQPNGTQPNYLTNIQNQMQSIASSPLCIVLGEVANEQDEDVFCKYDITDVYKTVLTKAQTNNMNWLAWMWHYDACPNRQMSNNNTSTNLSVFGNDVVNNVHYGLKATAKSIKLTCN